MAANTTYYLRVGGINWNSVINYVTIGSTLTNTGLGPIGPTINAVYITSITAIWTNVPNTTGFDVEASSTNFNGTGVLYSSITVDTSATSLTGPPKERMP